MGRQKTHKPRGSRPQVPAGRPDWFGSALHDDGWHHADLRPVSGSVQMTLCLAETDQGPGTWVLRLRGGGDDCERMGAAMEEGRLFVWPDSETAEALAFIPHFPADGEGTIGRAPVPADGEDLEFTRRKVLPMPLCAEMGRNLRRIAAALDPGASPDGWRPEDSAPCQGCGRPIFDSMPTAMVLGGSPLPVAHACPLCAGGETLARMEAAGVGIPPGQRAVLDSIASTG